VKFFAATAFCVAAFVTLALIAGTLVLTSCSVSAQTPTPDQLERAKAAMGISMTKMLTNYRPIEATKTSLSPDIPAKHGRGVLPPLEFDHPYDGTLIVERADALTMPTLCPKTSYPITLGCSRHDPILKKCVITIATNDILGKTDWSFSIVRRHEIGHCNGWPADHKGARVPTAEEMAQR
jgi:hypothetical protein